MCVCACVCAPRLSSSGLCVHAFVYINVHADGPAAVSSSKRVCVLRPARSLRRLRRRLRRRCRRRHRPGHQVHATAALLGVLSVAAAVSDGPTGCCFQRSSSAAAADHAVNLTRVTYIIYNIRIINTVIHRKQRDCVLYYTYIHTGILIPARPADSPWPPKNTIFIPLKPEKHNNNIVSRIIISDNNVPFVRGVHPLPRVYQPCCFSGSSSFYFLSIRGDRVPPSHDCVHCRMSGCRTRRVSDFRGQPISEVSTQSNIQCALCHRRRRL